jgi:hypothetical protein
MEEKKEINIINPIAEAHFEAIFGYGTDSYDRKMKVKGCPAHSDASDAEERKQQPLYRGVVKYFPDALLEVSKVSYAGSKQHNPDKPLHWDRSKSGDELDALMRHLVDAGTFDTDGVRHSAKVAWRALANLQKELEINK